jgi:hypothetical protein
MRASVVCHWICLEFRSIPVTCVHASSGIRVGIRGAFETYPIWVATPDTDAVFGNQSQQNNSCYPDSSELVTLGSATRKVRNVYNVYRVARQNIPELTGHSR